MATVALWRMGAARVPEAKTAVPVLLTGAVPVLLIRAVPVLQGVVQARGATMTALVPGAMARVAAQVRGAMVMVVVALAHREEACLPEIRNHFQFLLATY